MNAVNAAHLEPGESRYRQAEFFVLLVYRRGWWLVRHVDGRQVIIRKRTPEPLPDEVRQSLTVLQSELRAVLAHAERGEGPC